VNWWTRVERTRTSKTFLKLLTRKSKTEKNGNDPLRHQREEESHGGTRKKKSAKKQVFMQQDSLERTLCRGGGESG